jgi:hypothetical protein
MTLGNKIRTLVNILDLVPGHDQVHIGLLFCYPTFLLVPIAMLPFSVSFGLVSEEAVKEA